MSEETLKEIKEKLANIEKRIDAMENEMKKLKQRFYECHGQLAKLYDIELNHYKEVVNLKEYVKQLKQNVISLHENELSYEDIENMFPDDSKLEPES